MLFWKLLLSAHLALYPAALWCDSCGNPLDGSTEAIACECHGIRGAVCEDCAEWHDGIPCE